MYLSPAQEDVRVRAGWPVAASVGACATLTVLLGLFWAPVAERARAAAIAAEAHPDPHPPIATVTPPAVAPSR